jgi:hypothetical protein
VADVRDWPDRIDAVDEAAIRAACMRWLDDARAVTGFLKARDEAAPLNAEAA